MTSTAPSSTAALKVAGIQMVSGPSVEDNLAAAGELIGEAAAQGARLVALPENFCFLGRRDTDKLAVREPAGDGPVQRCLADLAARHGVWIVGGTLPMRTAAPAKVNNTCLLYDPAGRLAARYDKIHLFGLDRNGEHFAESDTIEAGRIPVVADVEGLRLGMSVCYDLRFPELYRAMAPVDLILVPSAFTYQTGEAHWEILLRARAIENQCYVLAPAQGGVHPTGRRTWGRTVLIDPWGEVLAVREEPGPGVVLGEIDPGRIAEVRRSLPSLRHRVM